MTTRISELPLTNEKVMSAIQDFNQFKDVFFKGINIIMSDKDYPDIKLNVYKSLSDETKENFRNTWDKKLRIRKLPQKKDSEISNILINKLLIKYGTGIKQQECVDLTLKIIFLYIVNMAKNDEL